MSYHDSRRPARLVNPVDPRKAKSITYDERGLPLGVDDEGGLGRTTLAIDAERHVTSVTRATSATASDAWSLITNAIDALVKVTDPEGKALVTEVDDLGRVVKQSSPDVSPSATRNSYTPLRRLSTSSTLALTKRFSYDSLGRLLAADYPGRCASTSGPEIQHSYDRTPQGMYCPLAAGCIAYDRLVYSKVTLLCNAAYADGSLDQETFYAYDFAGRLVEEYIRDDSGRVASHKYAWDKNGNLLQTTLPSGAVLGATYGSPASNSDAALPAALWRTSPATPIIDHIEWNPGGVLEQYNRFDTIAGVPLRMRLEYNLAYRPTSIRLEPQNGYAQSYYALTLGEDAKGRVTKRDIYPSDPQLPGVFDSYFLYDQQDRLLCETTAPTTSCPTSGATLKNGMPAGYTGAGDRKTLLRPIAGSAGGVTHVYNLAPGTHRVASIDQPDGAPALGTTSFGYDPEGRRTTDGNVDPATHLDGRQFGYDARGNLVTVSGQGVDPVTGELSSYVVRSAFDARNRRVWKSHRTASREAQWFFYYDARDRLAEVRHTPDVSTPGSYSVYQLVWLDDLLVATWQTDYPSGATSKRYVEFDETGRPVRMHAWVVGNSQVVWAINPDAWGADRVVIGAGVFQPIVFAGQYRDAETAAYLDDGVTVHRPGLVLNGHRTYDPFTGSYLQVDPLLRDTWSPYTYADNDPVGKDDPDGLAINQCQAWSCSSGPGNDHLSVMQCTCTKYAPDTVFGATPRPERAAGGLAEPRGGGGRGGRGRASSPTRPPRRRELEPMFAALIGPDEPAESWWRDCVADLQEGSDPKWGGRVVEYDRGEPVGSNGGVARELALRSGFKLGSAAARAVPGSDYSGFDWQYRHTFCQVLGQTLDYAKRGGR